MMWIKIINDSYESVKSSVWYIQSVKIIRVISVVWCIGISLSTYSDLKVEQYKIQNDTEKLLNVIREQASLAVFNVDENLARKIIVSLYEYNRFQSVRIEDESGSDLFNISHPVKKSNLAFMVEALFDFEKKMSVSLIQPDSKKVIGKVEVILDLILITNIFSEDILFSFIEGFIQILTLSVGCYFISYMVLKKPFISLQSKIKSIDLDCEQLELLTKGLEHNNEFGLIIDVVNDLLVNLISSQDKCEKLKHKIICENVKLEGIVKQRTDELMVINGKLKILADTDELTGIYNRRYFFRVANEKLEREEVNNYNVAVIMFDLDNFKFVNDTFGHTTGDDVLRLISSSLVALFSENNIFSRYGGEEFIVLITDLSLENAIKLGELLRETVNNIEFKAAGEILNVSISLGLSMAPLHCNYNLNELIVAADTALYSAKGSGKNCLVVAPEV